MATNRHVSLLENRVGQLQHLLRSKQCPELSYICLKNVIAEGDGWSDWEDFIDHGRFAAIERNWYERTLKGLERLGVDGLKLEDLRRMESPVKPGERAEQASL